MANPTTPEKGNPAAPGAAGKTDGKSGPYDPKPGAAVKGGKGRTATATATSPTPETLRRKERRPDLIKKRREELKRTPEKRKKEQLYTRIGFAVVGLLVVALIAYGVQQWIVDRDLNQIPTGTVSYEYQFGQHDDTFESWTESPPVGGPHNNVWQTCGYYAAPIGKGNAVHSLEHGAVWITYRSDVPQVQLDELKKLADDQSYILVSPYQDQASPIVATAWNHQVQLQSADSKDLDRFIRVFKSNRKYTPEYGGSCVGTNATVG
jgi:hypothetical protein